MGTVTGPFGVPISTTPTGASQSPSWTGGYAGDPTAGFGSISQAAGKAYTGATTGVAAQRSDQAFTDPNAGQRAAVATMTPAQRQAYYQSLQTNSNFGGFNSFLNKYFPVALEVGADAATFGAAAPETFAGSVAVGAGIGAMNTGINAAETGHTSLGTLGRNVAMGAIGGGVNFGAQQLSGFAQAGGVPKPLANIGSGFLGNQVASRIGGAFAPAPGPRPMSTTGGGASATDPQLMPRTGGVIPNSGTTQPGEYLGGIGAVMPYNGSTAIGPNYAGLGLGLGAGAGAAFLGGGQGNNGNMAGTSTDSTLASTITGALPGLLQSGATSAGAVAAGNAQVGAENNAITTQQSTLGNIGNIWSKQQSLGQGADTALGSALGTNGQPADYSGFENMPGYKFAVQQGTQAIQRQAASMGSAYTPNTAAAVGQYVTGTASQDYNTYISQLMGAAGLGSTANAGIADPTYKTGTNISQLQQNIGDAKASEYTGVGSATSGLFSPNGAGTSLIGAAGNYLGRQFGGGGGGGGGSGMQGGGGGGSGYGPNGGDSGYGSYGAGTTNGGVDPSTGVPYDIQNPGMGTAPPMSTYDPVNPLGLSGYDGSMTPPISVTPSPLNVDTSGFGGGGSFGSAGSFGSLFGGF